jgi:hypothetical protein
MTISIRKITIALVIGFLYAATFTHITYTCAPETPEGDCYSLEKAAEHPKDFLHNKQGSLVHFSETFVEVSLVSFAILNVPLLIKKVA